MSIDDFQAKLDRALNTVGYDLRQADPLAAEMAMMLKAIHEAIAKRLPALAQRAIATPQAAQFGEWPTVCRLVAVILIRELRSTIEAGSKRQEPEFIDGLVKQVAERAIADMVGMRELGNKIRKGMG